MLTQTEMLSSKFCFLAPSKGLGEVGVHVGLSGEDLQRQHTTIGLKKIQCRGEKTNINLKNKNKQKNS